MKKLIYLLAFFPLFINGQITPIECGTWTQQQRTDTSNKNFNYLALIDSTRVLDTLPDESTPTSFISGSEGTMKKVPIASITDIPNFALLNGRSGGQTLNGGTAANEILTLQGNNAASGNTGVAINFNVANSGVFNALKIDHTGRMTIQRDGLAAVTDDSTGLYYENTTDATLGVPIQSSPSNVYKAALWDTDNTLSTDMYMKWQLRGLSSTAPVGRLYLMQSTDNTNWNDVLYIQKGAAANMHLVGGTGADNLNFATLLTNLITGRQAAQDIDISLNSTTVDRKINFGASYGADDITSFQYKSAGVMWHGINTTSPTGTMDINGYFLRLRTAKTPATSSADGYTGQIAWDADYIYICTNGDGVGGGTDTWKRVAIATW